MTGVRRPGPAQPPAGEPTLDQLLAEPIVQQLMCRDRTDEAATRRLLQQIAAASPAPPDADDPGTDGPIGIARLLHETARVLRKRYERELRVRVPGLTAGRCAVLVHLARHQGVNQTSLADSLGITAITLVRLLDRLEADGLVARLPAPGDRRAHLLVLTAKARPIIEYAYDLIRKINDDLQLGISTTEASQLGTLLRRIRSNLADRRHEAAPSEPLKARHPA
jgi:DNA-binding MarR family transcriptional regulator